MGRRLRGEPDQVVTDVLPQSANVRRCAGGGEFNDRLLRHLRGSDRAVVADAASDRQTGFARRGFNIDSLAVGVTEDPTLSRITLVVSAADTPLEQITKQLHKLVHVIKIQDLDPGERIDRELVLFKVNSPPERRHEVIEVANVFRAKIVDVGKNSQIGRAHV